MGKNKMSFVIRKSTKNDCKEILTLIQELADYEKMPNGPKLTEKDLEEHGYNGPRPFFECLVAFEPSKPDVLIGFVLFFYTYSTWDGPSVFMEDLYVTLARCFDRIRFILLYLFHLGWTISLHGGFVCDSS